jgi:hypothetical protein
MHGALAREVWFMSVQFYSGELDYIQTKLGEICGPSLRMFLLACLKAGAEDYELLRPALNAFQSKYPVGQGVRLARSDYGHMKVQRAAAGR